MKKRVSRVWLLGLVGCGCAVWVAACGEPDGASGSGDLPGTGAAGNVAAPPVMQPQAQPDMTMTMTMTMVTDMQPGQSDVPMVMPEPDPTTVIDSEPEPDPMTDTTGTTQGVPSGDPGDPASVCPAPPDGASDATIAALNAVNSARLAAGSLCATLITELNTAAQKHCEYYAQNDGMCTADPHSEVAGCDGFTGQGPGQRMMAAGYSSWGGSEVMAFVDNPQSAVKQWIDSVWHRIPVLDPWTTHMGYGGASGCDTIDFGTGTPAPDDTLVVWPYADQVDVPLSFDGRYEGPMPPAPDTGWPSAYPINVYAKDLNVTEHVVTVDGDTTPLPHVWITGADSNFLRDGAFMYPNAPFTANTTYRVRITGSYVGGPLELEWTFTTGEASRWGF